MNLPNTLPPLLFSTGVAHVAPIGPNVVVSLSGFEHGEHGNLLPITHRIVLSRESLAQGIEFLQGWLNGAGIAVEKPMVQ